MGLATRLEQEGKVECAATIYEELAAAERGDRFLAKLRTASMPFKATVTGDTEPNSCFAISPNKPPNPARCSP
jgi:hypothetical protein